MSRDVFTTVRTEGALLPPDLLQRVAAGDRRLGGLEPTDYGLGAGDRLHERIAGAWSRLTGTWAAFQPRRDALVDPDVGHTITRERWLLPLFDELGFGRLTAAPRAQTIGDRSYAIYASWGERVPIHLVGCKVDLDRRQAGVVGAAAASPHGLLQELLNRDEHALWGVVSNGLRLRLLRDSVKLSRQAFVEFDLESMLEGEVYSDFALLWLLCHRTRFEGERPAECWLERWSTTAAEEGARALDQLRGGVEQAIVELGRGFLAQSSNGGVRARLESGALTPDDYYRQLLRMVYRLIFLFVAEDRELLLDPSPEAAVARERFGRHYSTRRVRRLAGARRGTRHGDLWAALSLVMEKLDDPAGCAELALKPLGSFLWSREAVPDLAGASLSNASLLAAVRALSYSQSGGALRPVDYRNLGAEELGSVYESLLELHPRVDTQKHGFDLDVAAGSERKTTGSYYTPTSLIQCLLDSALDPVVDAALEGAAGGGAAAQEQALLALKICDPACGSGHFLIAAAHRLARRLAQVRTGDAEPSPDAVRAALRAVIGRCLFGIDLNPMAVELCKVSLWLEALEPGKPLSFLEHHILCGNSLLGTTPELIAAGLPDEAFDPLEGDEKKVCQELKKRNKRERAGQATFAFGGGTDHAEVDLAEAAAAIDAGDDATLDGVRRRERAWRGWTGSSELARARELADAWCAAFVWPRRAGAPAAVTTDTVRQLVARPEQLPRETREEIQRLAAQYRFFHWHLAFPTVFVEPDGTPGGFDVVLGNPPWERVKLQEQEFFAARDPDIAAAPNAAARRRMIAQLPETNPALHCAYLDALREADGVSRLIRQSGRFPLCGRGDVNTYAVFAELMRGLMGHAGRVGCIVPSGIATDDTTKFFFQDLMTRDQMRTFLAFENEELIFPAVYHRFTFALMTMGAGSPSPAEFVFRARSIADLDDPERRFTLSAEDIALLNPNTRTCPVFRTRRDAEITKGIYRRVPALIREAEPDGRPEENPWGVSFMAMFHMSNDSDKFRTRDELERDGWQLRGNIFHRGDERHLPLYEAKMVHHFNHRFGDYAERPADSESTALPEVPVERLQDPHYQPLPRYWVAEPEVEARLEGRWDRGWLVGWRDITNATNERTVIAGVVPKAGTGNQFPLMLLGAGDPEACLLGAILSSLALDFTARSKVGGTHLNFFIIEQLPVLPPAAFSVPAPWDRGRTTAEWFLPRVLELTYTSGELQSFARHCGYDGAPFRWDEERRALLRAELDAAFFHLYGVSRDDAAYILDTFPIITRKDEARFGEYRTKRLVLEIYDGMISATATAP